MSCEAIRPTLATFDLGGLSEDEFSACDAHLRGCHACVAVYLDQKRETFSERAPSRVQAKLRAALAKELGLGPAAPAWWHRPLAVGVAVAIVLGAMVSVNSVATRDGAPPIGVQRDAREH